MKLGLASQDGFQDVRQIRVFDGHIATVDLTSKNRFTTDIQAAVVDFSWRIPGLLWHDSVVSVLADMLSTHSISYVQRCTFNMGALAKRVTNVQHPDPVLRLSDLEDFPRCHPITVWPFVQATLRKVIIRDLAGLDPDIVSFLNQPEKWEEKGKGQYFALIANDPERGALTEQELTSVNRALNESYSSGAISTKEWALTTFLVATGVRPIQMARFLKKDVILTTGPEGVEATLMISLAKNRDGAKRSRWKRKSPTQLTEVLQAYLALPEIASLAPDECLFFNSSAKVSACLSGVFSLLETHSQRLGTKIPLFPYRLRYTLGTRAIALGASDEEVARLLTHTTLHCVQYYRAAHPSLQAPIAEALGAEMTIFARAFRGRLIETLDQATRRDDEAALITAYEHMTSPDVGACGTMGKCRQDAPRACLVCEEFEPFRGAPWEDLREALVDDRDREPELRIRMITQEQIDAIDGIIAERDAMEGTV